MICEFNDHFVPRTQMTPIFEGQPSKRRPFPIKTRVIWVPDIYSKIRSFIQLFLKDQLREVTGPKGEMTMPQCPFYDSVRYKKTSLVALVSVFSEFLPSW